MADPSASERAYQRLKSDIQSGALLAGPLDIRTLGDRLRMSVTPVREALARLSAERLIEFAPHQGYTVASLSARRLENLYELSGFLIDLGIERGNHSRRARAAKPSSRQPPTGYANALAWLAGEIARAQPNLELSDQIVALDSRLYSTRRCEPLIFEDAVEQADVLIQLWAQRRFSDLRTNFRAHFAARMDRAEAIARLFAEGANERGC
ncbi:MAG: GntR family transcriptional regulator [Hyphomonadaceae bacterium]|nr:GntR family transcriptional regulator [Hyphomonadaceae bacterium]